MEITGAIFDCDGTLVDSMSMWKGSYDWLYAHYGVPGAPMEVVEPLSLADACDLFFNEYGMGTSAEEVYETLCAHVREGYETVVTLMPGVRAFLDELRGAGVPMIIASSTPVRELRHALATHGLTDYFLDVVSTEDVGGRDKEFPDVYLEACRRLGTSRETTWVFEDAPFGVRSAHRAGFAVVGLMNDHDGRREEDVRPWCDVYCHGYPELSLNLLRDYERPVPAVGDPLRVLVVDGSPEPSSPELVALLSDESDYVICADGGADVCRRAGIAPDVFCGDLDSASDEASSWAASAARTCVRFPVEKYATDLALAIDCARHEAARRAAPLALTVTCGSGGRADHSLAVVGLLAGAGCASARIVEDDYEMRIVSPEGESCWRLGPEAVGRTFSAVAVAPDTCVSERGMQWELSDKSMGLLDDLGISNVVVSPDAEISCTSGRVAAYVLGTTKTPQ